MSEGRRVFLVSVVALVTVSLWRPGRFIRPLDDTDAQMDRAKHYLLKLFTGQNGLQAVGKIYLDANPADGNRLRLFRDLIGPDSLTSVEDLRRRLAHDRARDFVNADVVVVDGWVLARTEARAAALAVLL